MIWSPSSLWLQGHSLFSAEPLLATALVTISSLASMVQHWPQYGKEVLCVPQGLVPICQNDLDLGRACHPLFLLPPVGSAWLPSTSNLSGTSRTYRLGHPTLLPDAWTPVLGEVGKALHILCGCHGWWPCSLQGLR